MAYSSSISLTQTNVRIRRKVMPSTVSTASHVVYDYERKVYTPETEEFNSITGPIFRKSAMKTILRSDRDGGDITPAQYTALIKDVESSLTI